MAIVVLTVDIGITVRRNSINGGVSWQTNTVFTALVEQKKVAQTFGVLTKRSGKISTIRVYVLYAGAPETQYKLC